MRKLLDNWLLEKTRPTRNPNYLEDLRSFRNPPSEEKVPLLSDAELLTSPVMNEDSDCFLTVSFHILRMRLCRERKRQNMSASPDPDVGEMHDAGSESAF